MRIFLGFFSLLLLGCQPTEKVVDDTQLKQQVIKKSTVSNEPNNEPNIDQKNQIQHKSQPVLNSVDQHSFANTTEVVITHMHLDLKVDFKTQQLKGKNSINYKKINKEAKQIVLDTRALDIKRVESKGMSLKWSLADTNPVLGEALIITLPEENQIIDIYYETSSKATGLQWLKSQQTAGKQKPFLFTQSQAIHARSWIPCQDTPQVRQTYSARIQVDPSLWAVMSANNTTQRSEDGIYELEMPQAIPSYLIALAVGDLKYKKISAHVSIYAEKEYLDAAAYEFAETENMITATESMYGEYRWGDYDLLVLPPSFPFGGMENPRLSFITPTILAGDRSLDSLIAHELAHSWSGNLVTNASWRDLWLNEGFTSYLEARITEAVHGTDRMKMEAVLNYNGLKEGLKSLKPEYQKLAIELTGVDPDDGFSSVPYDKGRFFLEWMEQQVGRDVFDDFLNQYFQDFAFKSLNTERFLDYLDINLIQKNKEKLNMEQVKQWVYQPGLPEFMTIPQTDKFTAIDTLLKQLADEKISFKKLAVDQWTTQEWLYFLRALGQNLSLKKMQELDAVFNLTAVKNSEIAHQWLLMSIASNYRPAFKRLRAYLIEIGRRKLIVPLYEALVKTPENLLWAKEVYAKARSGYHHIAQVTIDNIFSEVKTK